MQCITSMNDSCVISISISFVIYDMAYHVTV